MQRPRSLDGGHFDDGLRPQRLRVHLGDLLELRRQVHLFHQVQIVVAARRAVRAQPDRYAGRALFDHRSNTARQHHVAGRIVHATHLPLRQDPAVRLVNKNAVRRHSVRPENTELIEILYRCGAVLSAAVVQLFFHFCDVDENPRAVLPRQRR